MGNKQKVLIYIYTQISHSNYFIVHVQAITTHIADVLDFRHSDGLTMYSMPPDDRVLCFIIQHIF